MPGGRLENHSPVFLRVLPQVTIGTLDMSMSGGSPKLCDNLRATRFLLRASARIRSRQPGSPKLLKYGCDDKPLHTTRPR